MDLEMGEIGGGRDEDARATFRDDADELGDEMEIDNVGKEKSRESEKHRSKDRSKGRREEKEHGSRGRERSKERENDEYIGRDSDRYDVKDRDRSESGRDRKKEERSEYGKDRERDKDRDRDKEKSRDRLREEDHDRDKYREKERDKDRGKERDRESERSTDRDYDRSRDHGKGRGKEREKDSEIEKERDLMREYERGKERDRDRSKIRERDHEKDVHRESERERRKEKDHEKGRDKNREKEKDRDRARDREREKEKIKDREKEKDKDKDRERDRERDKGKEKYREKEIDRISESDRDKSRARDREKGTTGAKEGEKDERTQSDYDDGIVDARKDEAAQNDDIHEKSGSKNQQKEKPFESTSTSELEEQLAKMKEERTNKKSDGASEILSWVNRSRRIDEKKNAEKEALRLSKVFEEQDNILDESEDDEAVGHAQKDLAGVKILHGLDKVIEGGAVVLTLKDQDILKDGDVNDEIDMLENVEIGEQKQRDEAYRAAKKRAGLYDDKFSDDTGSRRGILPQYDDPVDDEGVAFDESGHFTGEAEKKLEELRKRIEGSSLQKSYEDLTSAKMSSDYYTPEEMLQFKKPKKKKSLRKKEKLNLDAMEAEAISAGLGASDLGSRNDMKRQTAKEEKEKIEAEMRSKAYQAAYEKAEEASKVLRQEQTLTLKYMDDEDIVFGEDYEDLQRSLEQARRLAIRKQDEAAASGPQAVALLATYSKEQENSQSQSTGDPQEEKVVITEVEEFVLGLQLNEGTQKPESEDVFMDEEDAPKSPEPETKADVGGWTEVEETSETEVPSEKKDDAAPDEIIHEVAVGKGLSGALKLLKERGALKETIDWGGRTMDKKKSKLVGLYDNEGTKEIRIERTDEFGRVMTPKEAFRMLSHKFHGKGPGKMKLEKKMKQYQEDLKTKQMKASDTPLLAVEKMREAQAQLKTPYLVLSGHVKPGQTSDPRSGFATVEKDHLGSLTPMLGDKKVEHFLGIKRKPETGSMGPPPPKKPKN